MMLFLCMAGSMVEAASAKKLFTVQINDGYEVKNVDVLESADGGSLALKTSQIAINPASKKITAQITKYTSYYKKHYTDSFVTAKAAPKSGKSKKLTVKATNTENGSILTTIKILRPAKPKIKSVSLSTRTAAAGEGMIATVKVTSKTLVSAKVRVQNAAGKTVRTIEIGSSTQNNPTLKVNWDGLDDAGDTVEEGAYKLKTTISYLYGKKTKTVSKTVSLTVKGGKSSTSDEIESGSGFKKTWNWTVYLTGNDTVDYLAEYICQSVLNPGMSEVQRAKKLFNYCANHFSTSRINGWSGAKKLKSHIDISSAAAKAKIKAYGKTVDDLKAKGKALKKTSGKVPFNAGNTKTAMVKYSGDCLNMARMYQVLCRHAGLDADILQNSLKGNDPLHHFWNVVKIGGSWYECDPRMAFLRKEGYVHFLRGTKFMESKNDQAGNNSDNVRQYSNIHDSYKEVYAKVSKKDCPGR